MIHFKVKNKTLLLFAGLLWILAGSNVMYVGMQLWQDCSLPTQWKLTVALCIFLFFSGFVFQRLFQRHTKRISAKNNHNCPFSFFDIKSWLIMFFMISLGVCLRHFQWLSPAFLSAFYCGLSASLMLTGLRFLHFFHKYS